MCQFSKSHKNTCSLGVCSTHTPAGPELSVLLFVPQRTFIPTTGHGPCTGVDTNFQAGIMDFLGHTINATWEFLRVRNEVSRRVTSSRPAVIQDNIFVSQILESELNNPINGIKDDLFIQITGERVPSILTTYNVRPKRAK